MLGGGLPNRPTGKHSSHATLIWWTNAVTLSAGSAPPPRPSPISRGRVWVAARPGGWLARRIKRHVLRSSLHELLIESQQVDVTEVLLYANGAGKMYRIETPQG